MFVLRVAFVLVLVAVAGSFVAFVLSGDRRYLGFAWQAIKYALLFALIVFTLLVVERLGLAFIFR